MPGPNKSSKTIQDLAAKVARLTKETKKHEATILQLNSCVDSKDIIITQMKQQIKDASQQNKQLKNNVRKLQQSIKKNLTEMKSLREEVQKKGFDCVILQNKLVDMQIIDKIIPNCIDIIDSEIKVTESTLSRKLIDYCIALCML